MRVLQLGPYPPPHGGVEINLVAIRDYLRAQKIPCVAVNLTRFRRPDKDGVFYPKSAAGVLWRIVRLGCSIVHLHIGGNVTTRLLGLGLFCSFLPGARTVLTLHSGGYPLSEEGRTARPATFRSYVFRRFDALIAVNEEIAAMFVRFGVPRHRVHVIGPHALPELIEGELTRELQDFYDAHALVLLTVSGLEPEYDLPLQIATLESVRTKHSGVGLVIIGSGSLEGALRRTIESKPYAKDILLCGDVPHSVTLAAITNSQFKIRNSQFK